MRPNQVVMLFATLKTYTNNDGIVSQPPNLLGITYSSSTALLQEKPKLHQTKLTLFILGSSISFKLFSLEV